MRDAIPFYTAWRVFQFKLLTWSASTTLVVWESSLDDDVERIALLVAGHGTAEHQPDGSMVADW